MRQRPDEILLVLAQDRRSFQRVRQRVVVEADDVRDLGWHDSLGLAGTAAGLRGDRDGAWQPGVRTGSRRAASRVASLRPLLWLLAWCGLGTFAFWHGVPWLKGTSVVSPAQAAIAAVGYTTGSEQTYTTGAIQDLQPGDYVLALDSDTGEVTRKRVVQTFRRDSDHLRILTLTGKDGREQTFKATDEHPFWSADAEAFIDAADLEIGEQVIGPQGEPQQVARTYREEHPEGVPVYNFEVEDVPRTSCRPPAQAPPAGRLCWCITNAGTIPFRNTWVATRISR